VNDAGAKSGAASWFGALTLVIDTGVVLFTASGELQFTSASACSLLGYETNDELKRHWPELRRLLEPDLQRAAGERSFSLDVELTTGERTRKLRLELHRLDEPSCDGLLALIRDRDMLDALEDELALAIQMRGLTRFYMEVVHDLKAPLNAMVINLELLKDTLAPTEDTGRYERQRRYVDVLGDEVQRLNRSLTSLLTQTPRLTEASQRFDLRGLIEELAAFVGPQAKAQHVTVETAIPDEPLPIVGRRDRLKQAVLNVAMNALDAMPEGGLLTIGLAREAATARVSVRDSGPGIPPEILGAIYAMHFTTKSGGTGIGLYVARSVVMAHYGTIRVDSTVGAGTVVDVTLPLASAGG